MPLDSNALTENQSEPLSKASSLLRLGIIGVVLLAVVGTFLYLGRWLSPSELTPARFTDGFQQVYGIYSGFRRNHAKGVCFRGFFESNGRGSRISKAVVFRNGRVPVIGRFSLTGGDPYVADKPDVVRGMGLQFRLPDGEEWRTAMIDLPVFPVKAPQGFYDNLIASQADPKTHKPDPAKMAAFLASHPETVQALKIIHSHPASSGFDNSTYNSLNAFRFTDAGGTSIPVRWSMEPVQPFVAASTTATPEGDRNYLFYSLIASIHQHPLRWHLILTLAQPEDPTNDASIAWPEGREHVDVGTLTLNSVESEETSPARNINFDPLVLPAGIAPSDDPLLSARSAVYSVSFTRRVGEAKLPSAITPADVEK